MDKHEEKRVVCSVMPPGWLTSVKESEAPDFLCVANGVTYLGVEVTELFFDQSDARLKKVRDYGLSILKNRAYRHKDDIRNLPVEMVTFNEFEGQPKEFEGIFRLLPPAGERLKLLNSAIMKKALKLKEYERKAPATDLVVVDSGRIISGGKREQAVRILKWAETRSVIQKSGFREVRLLIVDDKSKPFVMPTRLNIFVEEVCAFEVALKKLPQTQRASVSLKNHLGMLVEHLRLQGFRQCRWMLSAQKAAVLSDVAMFVFSKNGRELVELTPNSDLSLLLGESTSGTESEDQALSARLSQSASEVSIVANLVQGVNRTQE